ncbi:MAG: thermonuclease family protein [Bacillus sp. (in: firmicutes)]
MHQYEVTVTRVIDGDTIVGHLKTHIMDIKLVLTDIHFRLLGINTPELRGAEKEKGIAARDYLKGLIEGKEVVVTADKKDKYGRQLAIVYYQGLNINDHLLKEGYAVPYM